MPLSIRSVGLAHAAGIDQRPGRAGIDVDRAEAQELREQPADRAGIAAGARRQLQRVAAGAALYDADEHGAGVDDEPVGEVSLEVDRVAAGDRSGIDDGRALAPE